MSHIVIADLHKRYGVLPVWIFTRRMLHHRN